MRRPNRTSCVLCGRYVCVLFLALSPYGTVLRAAELLIADRLTDRIYRYDEEGSLIGVLVDDPEHLSEPNGLALSPDGRHLYVASRQTSTVVRYDYNVTHATNPTVIIDEGLAVPASLLFSDDGDTLFVSNLGFGFDSSTVGRFEPDGTPAGGPLDGWLATGRTGLALDSDGRLLAGTFQDGTVLRLNPDTEEFEPFIGPNQLLAGIGNLLVHEDDLYVSAGFSGAVFRYDAATGALDPEFTPPLGLPFPASLALAPDGNGFLVGVLGLQDGTGGIERFDFDGTFLETFAVASADEDDGFFEATGMLVVDVRLSGDFDGDGEFGLLDVNALVAELAGAGSDLTFDVNGDEQVTLEDVEAWLTVAGEATVGGAYLFGDANLDGMVSEADLDAWNEDAFTSVARWDAGDFNANGVVDGSDFNLLNANKGRASLPAAAVPEAHSMTLMMVLFAALLRGPLRSGSIRR